MSVNIDESACIGCGACTSACPLDLIELRDNVATLNDADACIECGSCVDACPLGVITL
ncbi:MAG: 4Fe-4S binding protein [Coriobacteriales bacterium]|nr:4Fe-4S binding protein [Coriobacteriales bacterium]